MAEGGRLNEATAFDVKDEAGAAVVDSTINVSAINQATDASQTFNFKTDAKARNFYQGVQTINIYYPSGSDQAGESIAQGVHTLNLSKSVEDGSSTSSLSTYEGDSSDEGELIDQPPTRPLPSGKQKRKVYYYDAGDSLDEGELIEQPPTRPLPSGKSGKQKRTVYYYDPDPTTEKTEYSSKSGIYRISDNLSLLGKEPISTSSRVFHAILHSDVTGDKKVAAKITPADEKHQREANIHFSVPHHKNIVERIITDTFDFRGQPSIYIVMECCDCNLDDHIKSQLKNEIPFDAQKYLSISRQIVVGLNYLHLNEVVHGDLKPGNVLLILGKNIVKLCDFGLSRTITGDKTSTLLTSPQGGTMGWQAPEDLKGTTKIGFKTDIFPLGLLTFHCLSYGKHPYGDEPVSWNHYIMKGKNRNLDGMLIPNADAAKVLVESMLQQNPADRPTAKAVLRHRIFTSEDGEIEGLVTDGTERRNLSKTSEGFFSGFRKVFKKTKGKDSRAKIGSGKTDQALSDEERKKKITLLSERVSALLGHSEHLEALKLLEELASLQQPKELDTALQMAECLMHLGRGKKAREAVDAARHMTSDTLSADDVFALGCDSFDKSSNVRAIILLRIASDLYKTNASPDDVVNGISKCMYQTNFATQSLISAGGRSRVIGLDFGVEYMKEVYEDLSGVENAESGYKAVEQASRLEDIAFNYCLANEDEKSLKPRQTGIEVLENQFGSDASKYKLYGRLLLNVGVAYNKLGKFSDAEKSYVKSIDVFQKVMDWFEEREKQSHTELTEFNLKLLRAKLGKL